MNKTYNQKLKTPWSIQVELVEGCTRLCPFCGLNGIREKAGNFKYMSDETAMVIATQIADWCPQVRVEFAMHGEPTAHPKYLEIIRYFRGKLPKTQMQMTTNGAGIRNRMAKKIPLIFEAGIDFILLDTYFPERDKLQEEVFSLDLEGIKVYDFYRDLQPKGFSPYHNHHRKKKNMVIVMDDLMLRDGESGNRLITNHAMNSTFKPPLKEPLKKSCSLPFRELSIRYNGDINICCNDWGSEARVASVHEMHLESIWRHERFEAVRAALQSKQRAFSPCARCDYRGSRLGLLPKYPPITENQVEIIKDMQAKSPKENGFPIINTLVVEGMKHAERT